MKCELCGCQSLVGKRLCEDCEDMILRLFLIREQADACEDRMSAKEAGVSLETRSAKANRSHLVNQ